MKTCGQCKHRWMECCLRDKRERLTVDADQEACESFELHLGTFDEAFEASLAKAREKHPGFVPIPQGWKKLEALASYYGEVARIGRRRVEDDRWEYKLGDVLLAEAYEFLEAFFGGDFERALEEAGDVVAVLYRALNGEGRTGDTGDTGSARKGDGEEVRS